MYPPPPPEPADFGTVLTAELHRIQQWRRNRRVPDEKPAIDPQQPAAAADAMGLIGVSFSGGGIRSATFNLGVLQALAKLQLLRHVDYLSTVSGGGYIGGWLTAMIARAPQGIDEVEPGLDPDRPKSRSLPQKAIAYLRTFSNYLTPKVSMLSADTWSLWAIWSRNTLLNLTVVVSAIAAIVMLARMIGLAAVVEVAPGTYRIAAGVFLLIGSLAIGLNLRRVLRPKYRIEKWVQILAVVPGMLGAFCGAMVVYQDSLPSILLMSIVLSGLFLTLQLVGGFLECFMHQHDNRGAPLLGVLLQVAIAAVAGTATAWMIYGLAYMLVYSTGAADSRWFFLTAGPPAMLGVFSVGVVVSIGLAGRDVPDEVREWIGRLGAWVAIYLLGWLALFGAAVYGPAWIGAASGWAKYTLTTAWIATTAGSLFAGKSAKTDGKSADEKTPPAFALDLLARVGPFVFMAGFLLLMAAGVHSITTLDAPAAAPPAAASNVAWQVKQPGATLTVSVDGHDKPTYDWGHYWVAMNSQRLAVSDVGEEHWYTSLTALFGFSVAIAVLMSWRIDINEFSLHHFYKNRLVRCYLGASRPRDERRPDPFTRFDPHDDLTLCSIDDPGFSGPFQIVNATLNLSSGRNLEWQERKGASFIFTPVYSGFDTGRDASGTSVSRRVRVGEDVEDNGYFPTRFVNKARLSGNVYEGIRLGTAVAISGAAASPNHGYHTSTAVAFLMTLFNVRLGWWLGNPTKPKSADWTSPTFGLPYTVAELFGATNATSNFVNLSDGGHFDNMGLYELVRRRCRYIVVCDAEQDQALAFGGLTTAIRMCRTDFGAEIDIDPAWIGRAADGFSRDHWAVGTIEYRDAPAGILIYIKSSLTGDEPADVLGYHSRADEFPHESTADQWFGEAQFESYRRLGQHIAEHVFTRANVPISSGKDAFFRSLRPR